MDIHHPTRVKAVTRFYRLALRAVHLLAEIRDELTELRWEVEQQGLGEARVWEVADFARRTGRSERTIYRRLADHRHGLESRFEGERQVIPHKSAVAYLASLPRRPLRTRGGRPRKHPLPRKRPPGR